MGDSLLSKRKKEKGQVAILFALVFTFLFVLFAFVVDFGHLIQNKINLQIAADTAAYAGAAWQARTLNKIAMVNYHMRQDFKELAMRVNVTHLRHNRNFPRGQGFITGPAQQPAVNPLICNQAHGYTSISGLQYRPDTNLCRNADPSTGGLPPIVVPPVIATFDPFAVAISAQIKQIQEASNRECRAAANDNLALANHLAAVFARRAQFHRAQINELVGWLNGIANENPATSNHPVIRAAFQSARRNLTLSNEDEGFSFQVLQPQGGQYLQLEELVAQPSVFYIRFSEQGNGCVGRFDKVDFQMPVGFTKVPGVITYFAVKLRSRPRLFFMPERWVSEAFPELVAYSAAKPFGSRIGPNVALDQLVPTPNRPGNASRFINFSFIPNDTLGIFNSKVMAYLDAIHPFNGAGRPDGNQNTGWPEPDKPDNIRFALQAIRAPTILDSILYTTFPDPNRGSDDYIEPEYAEALYPDYLEAADAVTGNVLQSPTPRTAPYFPGSIQSVNRGPGWIQINANNSGINDPFAGYAEERPSSHSITNLTGFPQMNSPNQFGWATREQYHSGWAPEGRPGRIGYSVRFISFDALVRSLIVTVSNTGATGTILNRPTGDDDLSNILH